MNFILANLNVHRMIHEKKNILKLVGLHIFLKAK